jgi:hypothetical protein
MKPLILSIFLFRGCRLPEKPNGGSYRVKCPFGKICPTKPGEILADGALVYSCDPGFTIFPSSFTFCISGANFMQMDRWSLQPYCYSTFSISLNIVCIK